jgi:ABC-2 type transport system permease protein
VKLIILMIWKEFLHLRSDRISIRLMTFPVVIQIMIMGYALTTEVKNTHITVLDLCNSPSSRSLLESIQNNNLFIYDGQSGSSREIHEKIDAGKTKIGVVIPIDFNRDLQTAAGAKIQLIIDGQDANSSKVANGYVNAIIGLWGNDLIKNNAKRKGLTINTLIPINVNTLILFNPSLKSTWYMVPALVVILITMVTSLLTGLSIVREKEKGTLEQLLVTPVEPIHIIFGKTVPYLLIGFAELAVFLVFSIFWFGIPFRGNFFVLLLFAALYMMSSLGIGILTSTVAQTPQQVLFLIWFFLIFFILLSGFFVPVENMPRWVQKLTAINPVKYFMFVIRELCLKGTSIKDLTKEIFGIAIIGIFVFSTSILFFQRRAK